jgi:uncharacterized protein
VPRRRLVLGLVLYAVMAVLAVLVAWLRGTTLFEQPAGVAPIAGIVPSLVLGVFVAALTIGSTRALTRHTAWARALRVEFRAVLKGTTGIDIVLLALASGTAEELFFRGALQPWLGITAASLAFGLAHLGPTRTYLPWTAWAVIMGFLLGILSWATGSIVGPIVAHVAINAVNLRFVLAFDGALDAAISAEQSGEIPTMKLVGPRQRSATGGAPREPRH